MLLRPMTRRRRAAAAPLASVLLASVLLAACAERGLRIHDRPVPFTDERIRLTEAYAEQHYGPDARGLRITPRIVVLHWTALPDLESSYAAFVPETLRGRPDLAEASRVNVSVQFLVDRDGTIYRLMPETWMGRHVIGLNHAAIGVENVGGVGGRDDLTDAQIEANARLVRYLAQKYPSIEYLIGHHEYRLFEHHPLWKERDPNYRTEKHDPGERFMGAVRERIGDLGLKGAADAQRSSR